MKNYGEIYKCTDFLARTISRGSLDNRHFILRVAEFLQCLDETQTSNPHFTTSVHVGGGVTILWKGETLFSIWPAQKYLRLFWHHSHATTGKLAMALDTAQKSKHVLEYITKSQKHDRRGWKILESGIVIVETFVEKLPLPSAAEMKAQDVSHPRFFSGEVRHIALNRFLASGRICPGVKSTKRHKVGADQRIEFDHILPHALGGSRSEINVQVLCQPCNNRKRATAL